MKRIFWTILTVVVMLSVSVTPAFAAPLDGTPLEQSAVQPLTAMPVWGWLILSPFLIICALMFLYPLLRGSMDIQDGA